jgi:hypothetical protein
MFMLTGLSPAPAARSSGVQRTSWLVTRWGSPPHPRASRTTPCPHRSADHSADTVWAARVSLATTPRILSFPPGTEMFQFPRFPPHPLCVQGWVAGYNPRRIAPFGHPRISAWEPLPEVFRRVPAPFIGPASQGIHHAPIHPRCRSHFRVPATATADRCVRTGDALHFVMLHLSRPRDMPGTARPRSSSALVAQTHHSLVKVPGWSSRLATSRPQNRVLTDTPPPCDPRWNRNSGPIAARTFVVATRPVEPRGLEPRTSAVQGRRSPN